MSQTSKTNLASLIIKEFVGGGHITQLLGWSLGLGTTFLGDAHAGQQIQEKCPSHMKLLQWRNIAIPPAIGALNSTTAAP